MISITGSSKVVFINQPGNQKCAQFIEAINDIGEHLLLFVILKGKKQKDDQFTIKLNPGDRISLSENGQTDNKFCMGWRNPLSPIPNLNFEGNIDF